MIHHHSDRRAFTLIELLVVMGIIVILMALLLPLASAVRNRARAADTQNLILNLVGAIQRYNTDFSAYPGPFPNFVYAGTTTPVMTPVINATAVSTSSPPIFAIAPPANSSSTTTVGIAANTTDGTALTISGVHGITQTENLFLALTGGLSITVTTSSTPYYVSGFLYDKALLGSGPQSLNPANPLHYPPYMTYSPADISSYYTSDGSGLCSNISYMANARDTEIPEFVDRFSKPRPIIYMRANSGASTPTTTVNTPPVVAQLGQDTSSGTAVPTQYNWTDVDVYAETGGTFTETGTTTWGPGGLSATYPAKANMLFQECEAASPNNNNYVTYFGSPGSWTWDTTVTPQKPKTPPTVARQQNGFWLLSAGIDGVYGTLDDLTNFGGFQ